MLISTVAQAFDTLLSRIELNPSRVDVASLRYGSVKSTIEKALSGKRVSQIGSFQRKTKIRPADLSDSFDIDVLVSFGTATRIATAPEVGVTPQAALVLVRQALASDKTYKLMAPRNDAPTVVLEYADKFCIELVPAFDDKTGTHNHGPYDPHCYLVPTAQGSWVPADYDFDAKTISDLNKLSRDSLVPAVKMIKAFLRGKESGLKSFHIEILCAQVIPSAILEWETKRLRWGYQHILAYFLSNAYTHMTGSAALNGSYSPPMDSGMSSYQLRNLATQLSHMGGFAWKLCEIRDAPGALSSWHGFFGDPFPSGGQ